MARPCSSKRTGVTVAAVTVPDSTASAWSGEATSWKRPRRTHSCADLLGEALVELRARGLVDEGRDVQRLRTCSGRFDDNPTRPYPHAGQHSTEPSSMSRRYPSVAERRGPESRSHPLTTNDTSRSGTCTTLTIFLAVEPLGSGLAGERPAADASRPGSASMRRAQLAVDLDGDRHALPGEQLGVEGRPAGPEQRAVVAERAPELLGDVRRDRVEQPEQRLVGDPQACPRRPSRPPRRSRWTAPSARRSPCSGGTGRGRSWTRLVTSLRPHVQPLVGADVARPGPAAARTASWCAQTRCRKRCAPATPSSVHSRLLLGRAQEEHVDAHGVGAVAAISGSRETALPFDFDIFSTRPGRATWP